MIVALLGSLLFSLVVVLYVLLVLGFPYGEFAMGGKYKVIPPSARLMFVFSIAIQVFGILVLLQSGGVASFGIAPGVLKIAGYVFAVYLSLNVLMNAFSRSSKERKVMTPLSLLTAICYWVTVIRLD